MILLLFFRFFSGTGGKITSLLKNDFIIALFALMVILSSSLGWSASIERSYQVWITLFPLMLGITLFFHTSVPVDGLRLEAIKSGFILCFIIVLSIIVIEWSFHGSMDYVTQLFLKNLSDIEWSQGRMETMIQFVYGGLWGILGIFSQRNLTKLNVLILILIFILTLLMDYTPAKAALISGGVIFLGVYGLREKMLTVFQSIFWACMGASIAGIISADFADLLGIFNREGFQQVFDSWLSIVTLMKKSPYIGLGLGVTPVLPAAFPASPFGSALFPYNPHNGFVQIFIELGCLGAFLVSIMMNILIKKLKSIRNRLNQASLAATLASVLTFMMFQDNIWDLRWITLLALLVWICQVLCKPYSLKIPIKS